MRLREIPNFATRRAYPDLSIDRTFVEGLAKRIIEDLELAAYALGQEMEKKTLDYDLAHRTIRLLDREFVDSGDLRLAPEIGMVSPETVREYAKAPWEHDTEALALMARYVNGRGFEILQVGAESALGEGLAEIRFRHLIRKCEDLPYPLNLYAC
jgi:hypothetical protein